MKLAFSTNAFKKYSLKESIRLIREVGYEGVEILCDVPHAYPPCLDEEDILSIQEIISKNNIEISNLNAFTLYAITDVYHPSWIESDKQLRELRIQHTINCLRLAKKIGAKNISTEPGGPIEVGNDNKYNNNDFKNNTNNKRSSYDLEALQEFFVNGIVRTSKVAEEYGVKILVEPEPGLLLENSEQFLKFIKNINSHYVGLNFDMGHFFCVREDPAALIYNLAEHIGHFHLADIAHTRVHNHLIPGQGSVDFASIFKAISEINYQGFITVELYPYQDDPVYAARISHKYLTNVISQI
ncbi:MAG: sugar phosphate isomerase/epimerase family protein [Nitrososphaeraceae archaeon]|jgi:sugar phosphate isomerase/epimerase